jgi:protein O-GlcNAc transferase
MIMMMMMITAVFVSNAVCFSLKATRVKVWRARTDSPLFDCLQYAQGMEKLYKQMWERHSCGEKPDHIVGK